MTVGARIQARRDTAANWTTANPVLAAGEAGLESDTGKVKYGDGTTAWTALGYFGSGTYVTFLTAATTPDLLITGTITRDANGAATSAPVTWPDGTPGTYTATTVSAAFPGAVDAYTITYGSPVTKTYTQAALTRNSAGAVTARPAVTVA